MVIFAGKLRQPSWRKSPNSMVRAILPSSSKKAWRTGMQVLRSMTISTRPQTTGRSGLGLSSTFQASPAAAFSVPRTLEV